MFSTTAIYEVLSFSVGDTKAGTKMGKLQLKNTEDDTTLNCVLWEETLNRTDMKLYRVGNLVRIVSASFNERFNNRSINFMYAWWNYRSNFKRYINTEDGSDWCRHCNFCCKLLILVIECNNCFTKFKFEFS